MPSSPAYDKFVALAAKAINKVSLFENPATAAKAAVSAVQKPIEARALRAAADLMPELASIEQARKWLSDLADLVENDKGTGT